MLRKKTLSIGLACSFLMLFLMVSFAAANELEDFYMYDELDEIEVIENLQQVVADDPVPIAVDVDEPVDVALIFPALDLSDSWARGYEGFVARMDELEIPYRLSTMGSGHAEHDVQRSHLETALFQEYDYVIVGPTELYVQQGAIEDLIAEPGIEVIVWNYSTPLKEWGESREEGQPLCWVGFDHLLGARMLGDYIVENYDSNKKVAMMYGVPGSTTAMRGYEAKQIMEDYGMEIVYEHYAHWDRELAYEATMNLMAGYDVDKIHSISTAMTGGIVSALRELGYEPGEIIVNGWGGGSEEQEYLATDEIEYTVLRNQDDWGVVLAEIIKYDLEGRQNEIPIAFSGEMRVVDHNMDEAEIEKILEHAFRYSKEELGMF